MMKWVLALFLTLLAPPAYAQCSGTFSPNTICGNATGSPTLAKPTPSSSFGVGVSSVSNADGTLTISPTAGAVIARINRSNPNTWLAAQTFNAAATFGSSVTFSSSPLTFSGLSLGTQVSCLGLDASNHLVFSSGACGTGGGGGGVTSLNSLAGALNITAGTNITVTPSGSNIQISSTGAGGGSLNITRAQIPTTNTNSAVQLILAGYALANDDGAGAPYTCINQSSLSLGAIQDSMGTWCAFDKPAVNNGLGWIPGWFGADHTGGPDSACIADTACTAGVPAFQRAIDAAYAAGQNKVYCAGTYSTSIPIFFDPHGNVRGGANWIPQGFTGLAGGYSPGATATPPGGSTVYVNNTAKQAWGSPLSPDATGMAMDLAYQVVASTSSVTYAPTYTQSLANGIIVASFKGSGAIGTPTLIGQAYPEVLDGSPFTTIATAPVGSLIVVAVNDISGVGITSVTDSAGHTYTRAPGFVDNGTIGGIYIFYSSNIGTQLASGGTITANGPGGGYAAVAMSVANANGGIDRSVAVDNTSSPSNAPTVSTGVLAQANEIVFGAIVSYTQNISIGYVEAPGFTTGTPNLWTSAAWLVGTTYPISAVVYRNGIPWQSLQNGNVGHDPLNDLAANADLVWWKPISETAISDNFGGTLYGPPQLIPASPQAFQGGCIINALFNNSAGLTMGPGNGMTLDSVWVVGPNGGVDCGQPATGAGIVVLSQSGGANRTQIRNSGAFNFFYSIPIGSSAIQTIGSAGTALAAENKVDNTFIQNSCVGFTVTNTQGFVNSLTNNTVDAVTSVITGTDVGVAVYNGNYSHFSQNMIGQKFAISTVSASYDAAGLKVTGTITSPDGFLTVQCTDPGTAANEYNRFAPANPCSRNVYNSWMMWPADYGVIPLVMVAYNTSTHVATWRATDEWYQAYGTVCCGSGLTTEIGTQTAIWATEMGRVFVGAGIDVEQIHIEPGQPFELVDSTFGFGAARATILKNININIDYTFASTYSPGNALSEAKFFAAQSFAFINIPSNNNGGNVTLDSICCNINNGNSGYGENIMVNLGQPGSPQDGHLFMKGGSFARMNFRYPANSSGAGNMTGGSNWASGGSAAFGQGDYQFTPWLGILTDNGSGPERMREMGWNSGPYWGVRPAPWTSPCISPTQYVTLLGTLPAIIGTTVTYPILWSGQQYKICDWNLTPTAYNAGFTYSVGALVTSASITYISRVAGNMGNTPASSPTQWAPFHYGFVSNHGIGFSYGQNITEFASWQIKNNSPFVQVSNTSGNLLFPGLGVTLTPTQVGCGAAENFIIREVHYNLQYFAVFQTDNDIAGAMVPSYGAATCSNSVIGQGTYTFTNLN